VSRYMVLQILHLTKQCPKGSQKREESHPTLTLGGINVIGSSGITKDIFSCCLNSFDVDDCIVQTLVRNGQALIFEAFTYRRLRCFRNTMGLYLTTRGAKRTSEVHTQRSMDQSGSADCDPSRSDLSRSDPFFSQCKEEISALLTICIHCPSANKQEDQKHPSFYHDFFCPSPPVH